MVDRCCRIPERGMALERLYDNEGHRDVSALQPSKELQT